MSANSRNFKDPGGEARTIGSAPTRPVDASETSAGEIENTSRPARKSVQRAQTSDSAQALSGLTFIQYRRIVASLSEGHAERNIAEAEKLPEQVIRRVRAAEIDRLTRQMSAVGVAFGGFLDNVKHLHAEIDNSVLEELRERVA